MDKLYLPLAGGLYPGDIHEIFLAYQGLGGIYRSSSPHTSSNAF